MLLSRAARARIVWLDLGSLLLGQTFHLVALDECGEGLVFEELKFVVGSICRDDLLTQAVLHFAFFLGLVVTILADIVILARFALVTIAHNWAGATAVACDALVIAKVFCFLRLLLLALQLHGRNLFLDFFALGGPDLVLRHLLLLCCSI